MSMYSVDDPHSEGTVFYRHALRALLDDEVPFLVGGAYALQANTGIIRRTKDFDIFVMPRDVDRVIGIFNQLGYQAEVTFPHWIAKAFSGDDFMDIIFNSGNGVCPVDEEWFQHAVDGVVLGLPLKLCPAEETIWQKAFIMERDRCDSADVAHLLRFCGERLDWQRLLRRFGPHWRVLYAHLVLFGFIYPSYQPLIPAWVLEDLSARLLAEKQETAECDEVCHGTLLSATQYLRDLSHEGFHDARLRPPVSITEEHLKVWTANFMQS